MICLVFLPHILTYRKIEYIRNKLRFSEQATSYSISPRATALLHEILMFIHTTKQIGRASCRERVLVTV